MHAELILGLLIAVAALVTIARYLEIPYPIFLVIGGLVLGLLPGVPRVHVDPDVIFLIVLPPLLYIAAYFTPVRNLRANLGTISSLAVGLVIASACAVAAAARLLIPGIPWPVAFALGAIVAPPDAIAATAVMQRLSAPRQIVTILEGESLLNDATALTIYSIALAVAAGAVFSPSGAVLTFAGAMVGGVAIGITVGWAVAHIRARLEDTPVEMTISLLTPFASFLPAERLGASGVIATVAAGLYLGHRGAQIMGPSTSSASATPARTTRTASSSSTGRSAAPSSTPSARRCCACGRRAMWPRKCCVSSSGRSTSRKAGWTPERRPSALSAPRPPLPVPFLPPRVQPGRRDQRVTRPKRIKNGLRSRPAMNPVVYVKAPTP